MRYLLLPGEDPRGMVVRPQATGDSKDGILSDGGFDLVVETGRPFKGQTWEQLMALALKPGYLDTPD